MGRPKWQGKSQLYATVWYTFGRVLTCLQKRTENGAIATQSQRIHSHLWIKLQLLLKKTLLLHELKTRPTLASGLLSVSAIFYPLMHGKFAKSVFLTVEFFWSLLSYPHCTENPAGWSWVYGGDFQCGNGKIKIFILSAWVPKILAQFATKNFLLNINEIYTQSE